MDNKITNISEIVQDVSSKTTTIYFSFPHKDGYKVVELNKNIWYFFFTTSPQQAEFILRSRYQVAGCKLLVFNVNPDYDIEAFHKDVLNYFNGRIPEENINVKQIGSALNSQFLVVANQIYFQYQPI